MIYVRADGNSKIGMGHVMRCIAISNEIKELGGEVTFILADEEVEAQLTDQGFQTIVLHTDYSDMETELDRLYEVLPQGSIILVDSYFVTENYLGKLKEKATVFYLDDVNAFDYPVDCIINGNIYGSEVPYGAPKVLAGCKYAPLRREYRMMRDKCNPEYLLFTTGSSDPYSITKQLMEAVLHEPELCRMEIRIVCGKYNKDYETLKALEKQYANIKVLQNVSDMWNIMSGAMAAVTAAGSTMTELSCLGVPTICFSFVDNQKRVAATYAQKGFVHFSGDYQEQGEEMILQLCKALKELVRDEKLRNQYSEKVLDLVDGLGSYRIAKEIIAMNND